MILQQDDDVGCGRLTYTRLLAQALASDQHSGPGSVIQVHDCLKPVCLHIYSHVHITIYFLVALTNMFGTRRLVKADHRGERIVLRSPSRTSYAPVRCMFMDVQMELSHQSPGAASPVPRHTMSISPHPPPQ